MFDLEARSSSVLEIARQVLDDSNLPEQRKLLSVMGRGSARKYCFGDYHHTVRVTVRFAVCSTDEGYDDLDLSPDEVEEMILVGETERDHSSMTPLDFRVESERKKNGSPVFYRRLIQDGSRRWVWADPY